MQIPQDLERKRHPSYTLARGVTAACAASQISAIKEDAVIRSESLPFQLSPASQLMCAAECRRRLQNPGCGRVFSEHMVTLSYAVGLGWYDARLVPYAPIQL